MKYEKWINSSKEILDSYDFKITLRQLYYVLVAKGVIQKTESTYQSLSKMLVKGRKKGDIFWDDIIDTTRRIIHEFTTYNTWNERIEAIIEAIEKNYKFPDHFGQKKINLFYLEKESLTPFIEPYMDSNSILVVGKGFNSWSNAYKLHSVLSNLEKDIYVYVLVDYDVSGKSINNSFKDQLDFFKIRYVEFKNIAITKEQIEQHNLPNFKGEVQLQALDPIVLKDLIIETCRNNWDVNIKKKKDDYEEALNIIYRKKLNKKLYQYVFTNI